MSPSVSRRYTWPAILAALVISLAGCAAESSSRPPVEPEANRASTAVPQWGHVHSVALDRDRLLVGTHDGLWQLVPGQPARMLSTQRFDVTGLTVDGRAVLASGHPGPEQRLPAELGLGLSPDGGRHWTSVSQLGRVDFHDLTSAGSVILGLSAADGQTLRSDDGGRTWASLGRQQLTDVAVNASYPKQVLATAAGGLRVSASGGRSWVPVVGAPALALVSWAGRSVYGVTSRGAVYRSVDAGGRWARVGSVPGRPEAMTGDGTRLVVVAGDQILQSTDAGATFTTLVDGVGTATAE